ncbi:sugar O-acetyltransferase [Companilactobacillus nodensis]|nr:sugar O-acetyltransferase [Companilactobacillus nodensis]
MRSQKEKMLAGDLYIASDQELAKDSHRAKSITRLYNQTTEDDGDIRHDLLKKLFGKTGDNIYFEPPFHTDYGIHTTIGEDFYANYDCIFLDIAPITIGKNVMFGPRVGLYTAGHPIDAVIRNEAYEYGKPIVIGDDVWIGGGVIVNPGVTIGSNVVIGSGSVITKDIPDNVIAVGNPCHVLREINENDKKVWELEKQKYFEN